MKELFKISGEYTYNTNAFNEDQIWDGYILVDKDLWFEGIVEDKESKELGPRYICGSLIRNEGIQLIKLITNPMYAPVTYSGINKGDYIECVWHFLVNDLFSGLKIKNGGLGKIVVGPKLIDTTTYDKVTEEIEQWKLENKFGINKELIDSVFFDKEGLEKKAYEDIMKKKAEGFKNQRKYKSEDHSQF